MPKLKLMFERTVLREIPLGTDTVTIGRLPHNTVVLDNPAVSGSHAEVRPDGNGYAVQDLDSLNGTFWNEQRVTRHGLRPGDVVLIGKHSLVFVPDSAPTAVPPPPQRRPRARRRPMPRFSSTRRPTGSGWPARPRRPRPPGVRRLRPWRRSRRTLK